MQVDGDGRVTGFEYKPDSPSSDIVTTEVFVFEATALMATLRELAEEDERDDEEESDRLEDFGHALLPRLVDRGAALDYRLDDYWKDLGTVQSYWEAHMDLLGDAPAITLDDPRWPIYTLAVQRPPARIEATAAIDDSLVSPGCTVAGEVHRSIIAPGSVIKPGAVVRDSVVLHDCVIGSGATVDVAVVDMEVRIDASATVGRRLARGLQDPSNDDITVIGRAAHIGAGSTVAVGARVEPNSAVGRGGGA
ncbi:MAG: sugar phosphate nucleotidyltransferase [Actinomycetota bacterium]